MNLTDLSAWCRQLVAVFPDAVPATRSELERLYEPKAFEDPSEFDCIRALRVAIWGMDHRTEFQSEAQKAWLYETVELIERY
jgi:hypothetical protein